MVDYITQTRTDSQGNPYQVRLDPNQSYLAPPTSVSNPIIDNSNAPVVSVDNSNQKTTFDSIQSTINNIKDVLAGLQKQQTTTPTTPTTPTPAPEQTLLQKIFENKPSIDAQIAGVPATPTLEQQINTELAKFGYTADSFKQVAGLSDQLTSLNKQMADLESKKTAELSNLQGEAGSTGFISNAEATVKRKYAPMEANLSMKSSALSTQINTMMGNYKQAEQSAADYVTAATQQHTQLVSDIKYSMDFYKDVYTNMDTSTKNMANLTLQKAQLEETKRHNQAQEDIDTVKAQASTDSVGSNFIDIMQKNIDAGLSPEVAAREAAAFSENLGIPVSQKTLDNWTNIARGMKKTIVPATPPAPKTPPSNPTAANIGKGTKNALGYVATLGNNPQIIGGSIVESAKAVGSFFQGLFQ